MIPFVNLQAQREAYKSEFQQAEEKVLNSGCFVGGPAVQDFEAELTQYTGSPHAITCGSGTDAITIALLALGLQPEDEVIVPDFTFIAPAECVMRMGGVPVFADIDAETLQISVKNIKQRRTSKTKGIIAVNLFGQCPDYKAIKKCAQAHGLWLIEDSAQAFGATQNGTPACTFGDISITSFYPAKPLGCYGDGGALFTHDDELAKKIRLIANHGSSIRYVHEICGMNSRLDAIQAAILSVKLRHLNDELKVRCNNANIYNKFFSKIPGITPQKISDGNTCTYAQYTLLVENRETFLKQLEQAQVPYCIHYPMPLHDQPCFTKYQLDYNITEALYGPPGIIDTIPDDLISSNINRHANQAAEQVVSLPICAFTNVEEIVAKLKKVM